MDVLEGDGEVVVELADFPCNVRVFHPLWHFPFSPSGKALDIDAVDSSRDAARQDVPSFADQFSGLDRGVKGLVF